MPASRPEIGLAPARSPSELVSMIAGTDAGVHAKPPIFRTNMSGKLRTDLATFARESDPDHDAHHDQ
jgi:hypothetical protein